MPVFSKTRKGKSLITVMIDEYQDCRFHEVDNLDTKTPDQAQDNYEKVFIAIRDALKNNEQYCCDDENDRLSIAQVVTDTLKRESLIPKKEK